MSEKQKFASTGGSFLLEPCGSRPVFTPEQLSEEQRLFKKTAVDFMQAEVLPNSKDIEAKKDGVVTGLLRKAGELGLLSVEIPEAFGGLGSDVVTSMLIAEAEAMHGSFSVSIGAHVGIGSLPIVYFGNDKQRQKYLPKLNSGACFAAYALTEPTSGSDALGAKTKAVLNREGTHYLLNGSKQWITNAGFADVFIVFAKIDGEKFTAFIVERETSGFSIGAEEHKLGIRGSSTCALTFEDAPVPVENVLGEIGKGHKIAFNILNHGRLKLGIGCTGGAKHVIGLAAQYAKARKAFGQPIAEFGLIKDKLGEMASRVFVAESMGYRTCGMIDAQHEAEASQPDADKKRYLALEEFNIEASMLKVFGSEVTHFVTDQALQIHGGYGYSEEYEVERFYRDSRINRIFEGTNEINRMLIPGSLLKRGMQGKLSLMDAFGLLQRELEEGLPTFAASEEPFAYEKYVVEATKRQALLALQFASMQYMQAIEREQELLALLADITTDVFAIDSAVSRTLLMAQNKHPQAVWAQRATELFLAQATKRIYDTTRQVVIEVSDDTTRSERLAQIDKTHAAYERPLIKLRRDVAEVVLEKDGYPLA